MQLTWTGQTQHMASVAANPPPLLAGALPDSLLLVRANTSTGELEVRQIGCTKAGCCLQLQGWQVSQQQPRVWQRPEVLRSNHYRPKAVAVTAPVVPDTHAGIRG